MYKCILPGRQVVHNTWLFDKPEKSVVYGPFTAFPKPAWFVTNKRLAQMGRWLTDFAYKPSWLKIPRIFFHALPG